MGLLCEAQRTLPFTEAIRNTLVRRGTKIANKFSEASLQTRLSLVIAMKMMGLLIEARWATLNCQKLRGHHYCQITVIVRNSQVG